MYIIPPKVIEEREDKMVLEVYINEELYCTQMNWDRHCLQRLFFPFEGKKVRVTIEVLK